MRKVVVLHLVTSSDVRGSETIALNQIKTSSNQVFEYYLCSLYPKGKLHEFSELSGVKSYSLDMKHRLGWVLAIFRLWSLVNKLKVDVIHVYGLQTDLIARLIKPFCHVNVIVSAIHSVYVNRKNYEFLLDRFTHIAVDEFISNTKQGADFYARYSGISRAKFKVIYTGVDPKIFRKKNYLDDFRKDINLSPDVLVITLVAEINEGKGHFDLIDAIKHLKKINENPFCLLCLGNDMTGKKFVNKIAHVGLNKEIKLLGFCDAIALEKILNSTDIQILPSHREGLPTALLEAMAYEIPIIATNVGGIPELINKNETGFLIPVSEPIALAEKLSMLMNNPKLRLKMGSNGRKLIKDKFSIQVMTTSIEERYKSLLSRH